jgi:hypothetical protein
MEAIIREEVVTVALQTRIDNMHRRDQIGAMAFVVALWVAVLFVLFDIWPDVTNQGIRVILAAAGILVLLFNTAAIVAMLRHYHGDKHFIYSLDIKHLDQMRLRRAGN